METPPPLPPPLPPGYQGNPILQPPSKRMSGWLIGLIVAVPVLLVVGVLSLGVVAAIYGAKQKMHAIRIIEQTLQMSEPYDQAQQQRAMDFANELGKQIQEQNLDAMEDAVDTEMLCARIFSNMQATNAERASFEKGFTDKKGGLLAEISGAAIKALRFHERDGLPGVTIRILPEGGGVNYADLLLKKEGDGFKVVDFYGYLFGNYASEESRRAHALLMGKNDGAVAKMFNLQRPDLRSIRLVREITTSLGKGDPRASLDAYEQLPPNVRRSHTAYMFYIQALQMLQEEPEYAPEYQQALEHADEVLAADSVTDLLLIDLYYMKDDRQSLRKSLENVSTTIGGDAYLDFLGGMFAIRANDVPEAEMRLAAAEAIEPDLNELVDLRMFIHATKGENRAVIETLQRFAEQTGLSFTPSVFDDPLYAAFRESPEYRAWVDSLEDE